MWYLRKSRNRLVLQLFLLLGVRRAENIYAEPCGDYLGIQRTVVGPSVGSHLNNGEKVTPNRLMCIWEAQLMWYGPASRVLLPGTGLLPLYDRRRKADYTWLISTRCQSRWLGLIWKRKLASDWGSWLVDAAICAFVVELWWQQLWMVYELYSQTCLSVPPILATILHVRCCSQAIGNSGNGNRKRKQPKLNANKSQGKNPYQGPPPEDHLRTKTTQQSGSKDG